AMAICRHCSPARMWKSGWIIQTPFASMTFTCSLSFVFASLLSPSYLEVRTLRISAIVIALTLTLSGCTSFLHVVKDEPIQPDPHNTSLGTDIDDFQIETAVGVNIKKQHPLLENAHVNVHSYNGVVLLTGEVPSTDMRTLADDTARNLPGVRQVHKALQIQ